MNKHTVELPIRIDCDDYHEFSYLETFFKKLNKNIHIREVGFDGTICKYVGIAYIGVLSNDECDSIRCALPNELQERR